jgi:Ni2+-binding GTPase involved in maturation of urease and hydrogenase
MEDAQILELLKIFEADNEWTSKNYEKLRKKYEGKIFAVKNKKIIHEAETIEDFIDGLEKKRENVALLLIETIPPKNVSFIL